MNLYVNYLDVVISCKIPLKFQGNIYTIFLFIYALERSVIDVLSNYNDLNICRSSKLIKLIDLILDFLAFGVVFFGSLKVDSKTLN